MMIIILGRQRTIFFLLFILTKHSFYSPIAESLSSVWRSRLQLVFFPVAHPFHFDIVLFLLIFFFVKKSLSKSCLCRRGGGGWRRCAPCRCILFNFRELRTRCSGDVILRRVPSHRRCRRFVCHPALLNNWLSIYMFMYRGKLKLWIIDSKKKNISTHFLFLV